MSICPISDETTLGPAPLNPLFLDTVKCTHDLSGTCGEATATFELVPGLLDLGYV
jgi:hypothetical protein